MDACVLDEDEREAINALKGQPRIVWIQRLMKYAMVHGLDVTDGCDFTYDMKTGVIEKKVT